MRITRYALVLIVTAAGSVFAEPGATTWTHDSAVEFARNGEHEKALQIFAELRETDPADLQLLQDETVVLAWANEFARMLANAQRIDYSTAPEYVVSTVARAARDAADLRTAELWYAALVDRDARNLDARAGLAMSHADAGQSARALSVLDEAPADQRDALPLILAEAYIRERQGRLMEALASYQLALEVEPDNPAALRGKALVLRAALLPKQALALALEYPGIISDNEVAQLEADVVALRIRHGAQSAFPAQRRYEGTDRALSQIDALLDRSDLDAQVRLRLRHDRIVTLADRLLMTEAIEEFEALAAKPEDVPTYVVVAAGKAYLYNRKPEQARDLLEVAVAREPGNLESQFPLFFAYADLQDHGRALELAESLLATIPPVNQIEGSPIIKASPDYLRAAILVGLARVFSDQLADSQEYFERLLAEAPHNTDLRQELANVYRSRGWLDRSLSEYAQVLAVEPDLMFARIGTAHTRLDSRDYEPVERELQVLREHYGDELGVKNLSERWQVHNRSEFEIEAEVGQSSGPTFGEDQYRVDATWRSQPFGHRYRVLLQTHDAMAEFPEGDAHRRRLAAGIEYGYRRWLASARLSAERSGGATGFRGSVDYRFSDLLTFGGILETESNATPLRGYRAGVSSDLLGLNAVYAWHESASVAASFAHQELSDGNTARSFFVRPRKRLINQPHYKLTLLGELSFENRDRTDVSYFSPPHAVGWSGSLRNDWQMLRRYDFALIHSLTVMAGQYDQANYATGNVWSLDYEFQAEISKLWNARVGISRRSNFYDGQREYSTFFLAGLNGRF
jgi:biofilm PGA synthesis protein PgaA